LPEADPSIEISMSCWRNPWPAEKSSAYSRSWWLFTSANITSDWFKDTGTSTTGWVLSPVGTEHRSTDGATSLVKQTTFISGVGAKVTLGNHTPDGYVKHFVVTVGTGALTPTSLADGTMHIITWAGRCSFLLI